MARPRTGDVETRELPLQADGKRIRGTIPYGIESRDMGGWREVIEPTALRNTKLDDLVATVDHAGVPIGRYPTTLELEDRDDGLHWAVDPPRSRQDVVEAVERGDLKAGSWRMRVAKDRWEGDVRYVSEISELRDVSVVTAPAYEHATVEFRSADQTESPEQEKAVEQEQNTEARADTAPEAPESRSNGTNGTPAGSLRVEERSEQLVIYGLADAYAQRGFFEDRTAQVSWDEFRSFTWGGGTVLTDLNPVRRDGVALGYDQRWLYPVLPTTGVSDATTAISYLRQSSRTLAGTAVIRAIDATSTKPETSSAAELQSLQLSQVATVQSGIPRIHAAQPLFQSIVEQDLRLAINDGLDELVRRGVATAGTAAAVTGNVLDKIRKAKTVVQGQGYNPDVLAIDPAGSETLDLLKSSGSEAFYVFNAGAAAPAPYGLQVRIWKTAGTALLDSSAFGRLYVSPVELRSFEADGGLTNKQNVRMETNAGYAVERLSAALRIL